MINVKHSKFSVEHYTPPAVKKAAHESMGGIGLDPASCELAQAIWPANRYFTEAQDGLKEEWHGKVFLNPPGGMSGRNSNMKVWFDKLYQEWSAGRTSKAVFVGFQMSVLRLCPEIFTNGLPVVVPSQRLKFWSTANDQLLALLARNLNGNQEAALGYLGQLPPKWWDLSTGYLRGRLPEGCLDEAAKLADYCRSCLGDGRNLMVYPADDRKKAQLLLPGRHPSHDNVIVFLPDRRDTEGSTANFYEAFKGIGAVPRAYG